MPGKNEKQSDFISRCIPIVINEGTTKDPKQAAAICYSIYKRKHKRAKGELSLGDAVIDELVDKIGKNGTEKTSS